MISIPFFFLKYTKTDIPHISSHLAKYECELVVLLISDSGVWLEFDNVVFEGDNVREEVPS